MLLLDSLLRASSGRIIGSTNVLFLFIWMHRGGLGNICRVLMPKFISILLVEGHHVFDMCVQLFYKENLNIS